MDEKTKRELHQRLNEFIEEPDTQFMKNCKMTVDFLDQVLSNYIVIGYDLDNTPFVVSHNKTSKDADALKTLITKVITGQDLNVKKM